MNHLGDDSLPLLEVGPDHALSSDDESDSRSPGSDAAQFRTLATAWMLVATLVRIVALKPVPLGNGEAYYFSWSRFLDWSYYDHPPLIAWLVRATTSLFGTSSVAVRLGPELAAAAFGFLFYRLAERFVRPRAAFFALVLVTALPVFLASSFIVNPEAVLAPLWIAFLLAVERMRDRDEPFRPIIAGGLLGLAFLAKYTALLLVPATFLYLFLSVSMRRWLRRPSFYAGGAVALVVALPVLLWNATRGWPSLRLHLLDRVGVTVPVAGENTVNHLVEISSSNGTGIFEGLERVFVGQLISYSPLLAPLLVVALVVSLRRARSSERDAFLTAFSWPVLLPLLAAMLAFKDAEQHWTMMGFVPAVIGVGHLADETTSRSKYVRFLVGSGAALSGLVFLLANVHARSTSLLKWLPSDRYDPRADMINELVGWDQVRSSLTQAATLARGKVVLAGNHYSVCGRMFFEMDDVPPVYCPTAKRSAFDFFERRNPPDDATVIALTNEIHDQLPAGLQDRTCSLVDEVSIERAGRHVARYFVRSCAPTTPESGAHVAQLGQ
jgi:hypothetical protein